MPSGGNFSSCNCGPDTDACASPTEPVATVGLCLADGTPIAVTVVRDCAGTTTSEGWINLATGSWSAGPPPAGTLACGESRSIQVSGTFCDVVDGDVVGLVLVEYSYAPDGSIARVRLVDAVTGQTYVLQGEVTTCPAGVEQPERDLLQLCDLTDDESGMVLSEPFVRDYQRDQNGAITGHTDYTLNGAPYTPTGTVGICPAPAADEDGCQHCETLTLCDVVTEEESPGPGVEVPWALAGVDPDPDSPAGRGFLFRLSPPDDPGQVATVRVTSGTVANTTCPPGTPDALVFHNTNDLRFSLDDTAQQMSYLRVDLQDFDTFEPVQIHSDSPEPTRLGGTAVWNPGHTQIVPTESNGVGEMYWDSPPASFGYRIWNTGGGTSCSQLSFAGVTLVFPEPPPGEGVATGFLRTVCRDCQGAVISTTDTEMDGVTPYTSAGEVTACTTGAGAPEGPADVVDCDAGRALLVAMCSTDESPGGEPCRDTSSTLLCDTAATDLITVFDPVNRPDSDGWQVVAFTGAFPSYGPEAAMPYPAPYGTPMGYPALGARVDQNAGPTGVQWPGYDGAQIRWVLRKTFTAPEDGVAVAQSTGFRGDGGARVRINGVDAGMYGQWNQPATSGTAQIPVTAGPNVVEIEVRDVGGINNVLGRLDIAMPRTVQFMRRQVTDCETGDVISTTDTTLDGDPYTVTGEVGQCEPLAECCEQPPPENRVDVETQLLCVRDQASGDITGQVIAERLYDDQSGDLAEQRLTTLTGAPFTLPVGVELTKCPEPDRITGQVCLVESGSSEFLTNEANAASGVDTDWQWAPNLTGLWYPMYRVAPNPVWTATDTAPNKAHWVSPHSNRTVCPAAGETSPQVPGTWYTRASWNLPVNVDPDSIRIAATVLNADNKVVQWRLNDGAWQPVGGGGLSNPAWTFPPTAVPGGRAGQNEIVVQILETQPAVSCPSPNEAGMILHVLATYDYEPRVWTQVIEDGRVYYLDQDGQRQDSIPDGYRQVVCGGNGGGCCPPEERVDVESDVMCIQDAAGDIVQQVVVERVYDDQTGERTLQRLLAPTTGAPVELPEGATLVVCNEPECPVAFSTECVGAMERTEASYDNTSLIGGLPGLCGSVQGPDGQFPCTAPDGTPFTIVSWIVNGEEVMGEGGGRQFNGGACGPGTDAALGMHRSWAEALTNLDPTGATWEVKSADSCAWFVGSVGGTDTAYGQMTIVGTSYGGVPESRWVLGPAQQCEETQYTKVYSQECDGTVSVSWLTPQGVPTDAPTGDLVPCGTGCGKSGGTGLDVEVLTLCDVNDDESGSVASVSFLRHLVYGPDGQVATAYDTDLAGLAPYTPTGTVGACTPATDECRDSSTLLVCDLPTDGAPDPAVTDTDPTAYFSSPPTTPVPGGVPDLWAGGVVTIGPDPAPGPHPAGVVRTVAATVQATRPACDTGTAHVRASVEVAQLGPTDGCGPVGWMFLFNGTTQLVHDAPPNNTPSGWTGTLTVETDVPAADLAAGQIAVVLGFDTYDSCDGTTASQTSWELSSFTSETTYDQAGCAPQVLANVVTNCETGEVQSVTYATLDGAPYTPAGTIGMCQPLGAEQPVTVLEACRCDDTDGDGIADTSYVELVGVAADGTLTSLGAHTPDLSAPYEPVAPVECATDGAPALVATVQAHRVEVPAGGSWTANGIPLLHAVTLTAWGADAQITTEDGTSTLHDGESASWSISRDGDAFLTGPLSVTAAAGTVTVTYTTGGAA